jgi:hypothetical protein
MGTRLSAVLRVCTFALPMAGQHFVPASDVARSAEALAQIRAASHAATCHQAPDVDVDESVAGRIHEDQWLYGVEMVVLARVESITPGWNLRHRHVTSRVTAAPVEILRDTGRILVPSSRVTFEEDFGALTIEGIRVCTESAGRALRVGDLVVIGGAVEPKTDRAAHVDISRGYRFLVRNDVVEVEPASNRSAWHDVPLGAFRKNLRRLIKE